MSWPVRHTHRVTPRRVFQTTGAQHLYRLVRRFTRANTQWCLPALIITLRNTSSSRDNTSQTYDQGCVFRYLQAVQPVSQALSRTPTAAIMVKDYQLRRGEEIVRRWCGRNEKRMRDHAGSVTSRFISRTARSKPTITARATMLWPIFNSCIPAICATGITLR